LATRAGKLGSAPYIPLLEENNSRRGFVDHGRFLALRDALPAHLKDPVTFLYLSGWRVSEMRTLEWRDVDLPGRELCLRPEVSKNKEGRPLPLRGELLQIIQRRAREKRRPDCPFVFHDDGASIGDFRKAMENGVQKSESQRDHRSRSAPHSRSKYGRRRNSGASRDGTEWTQSVPCLRTLLHRERCGSRSR
jgi:integrase